MPACKVGCCPDNICECSNDCECLLSKDADFNEKVDFVNPLLIAEQNLKGIPVDSSLKICPCRTKEELAEYVKPIEPRIHIDETDNTSVNTNDGTNNDIKKAADFCKNGVCKTKPLKGAEIGTHAPHGHKEHSKDNSCEEKNCTKTSADKDRRSMEGKLNQSSCADESCREEGSHPPEHLKLHHQEENSENVKKKLPRQESLPSKPSSNPNSPTEIAKHPNFEIRPNFTFDQNLLVPPVRKMKRSQSLAEARLGSLLNERRPSCFQLQMSSSSLHGGRLPDPHHGHGHHHIHEYHHAKHGYHSHGPHHHHHHHHNDLHEDEHRHGDCCSGDNSLKIDTSDVRVSCCEDPDCDGHNQGRSSLEEELKPLMKAEEAKVDVDEMILQTTKLRVQNMCCPKEGQIVQDELRKLEGIENIRVNVIGRVAHVSHFPHMVSPTTLMNTLNERHLGVSIVDTGSEAEMEDGLPRALKIRLANLAVQAVLVAVALGGHFTSSSWYMWVAIAEICFGIFPVLKKVYQAIRNREVDLNILITITVIGTLAIREWVEGAAVVFVFTLAGFLQRYCFYRVQKTISSLMLSKPSKAVMACTGECIPIEDVPIGSIIAVRQGELIPLDGIVVKGVASVDESSISGEATPVEKILESPAYSGTVIQNGYLEIETTSSSTSSTISKISAMVEDAQMNVSPTEILVNRFAKFYTPLVIVVSALVFLIPLFLGLGGVGAYEGGIKTWGTRALIVLVTACPCALLMATPTVVICGINGAARLGALIKGGSYLEALGQLNLLAFDKTGTLTEGKFQVVDLVPADNVDESDALRWAAAIESKSSHPLAAAVVNEFTGECVSVFVNDSDVLPDVSEFCTMEGQGISGKVEGHDIQVGNRSLLEKLEVSLSPKFEAAYISFCDDAKTVIFVCVDRKLALMISLADIIRWESRDALTWLQELGVHLCMLTGDAKQTANAVQKELKLDSCVSDMKPDDKLNWITDVKEQDVRRRRFGCFKKRGKHIVGMVGDGVNDGPALAASDVGIAMAAGGSALAVEAAGVALMNNSVLKVPEMICLSRFCRRIILQNIILSVLLKLVFVIVALTGFVRVWMAVLADLVGLLAVILNGLRPLTWKPPRTKKKCEPPRASFRRKRPVVMFETVV